MRESDETISGGARMISAISVKDRLKNQAAASGKTFQEALTVYGLERRAFDGWSEFMGFVVHSRNLRV